MCKSLFIVDSSSKLFTLDPATASSRLIGPVGLSSVTDIAFHGPTLYGVRSSDFLRINPYTGASIVIGSIGTNTNGLAVASDGKIYASGGNQLLTIDPTTGHGTPVGTFGPGLTSSGDLAFDSNDILYGALVSGATAVLARINRLTGAATVIGPMGVSEVYGMAFFCCRLFGVTNGGDLININVVTGNATIIGKTNVSAVPPGPCWGMAARMCCGCC